MGLWIETTYLDSDNEPRRPTTVQGGQERPTDAIARHINVTLPMSLNIFPQGSGASPEPNLPFANDLKISEHVDSSGKRHFTITTQGAGESPENWQARHDATHAALVAALP